MPVVKCPNTAVNRLLNSLPARDYERVMGNCESVELHPSTVIAEPGDRLHRVYFPTDGCISLVRLATDRTGLGVQLVGNEGMIGISLLLGIDMMVFRTSVQGPGSAWCLTPEDFQDALGYSSALDSILRRYLYISMCQLAQLVTCTRFHRVEARLARWLLMSQDRTRSEHFHITHQVLAFMLGVRRVGITRAAGALQQHGLIRYRRGDITVLDRAGLQSVACDCYGSAEALYERILGQ